MRLPGSTEGFLLVLSCINIAANLKKCIVCTTVLEKLGLFDDLYGRNLID